MSNQTGTGGTLRARILGDEEDRPIQLVMSAEVADDLAFITEDFATQVVQNSDESARLVRVAELVSARLKDCLAARSGGDGD